MTSRRALEIAFVAAVVATVGDLMMLRVANSMRPELALQTPSPVVLPLGGLLGVLAIPLYGVGYAGVAGAVGAVSRAWARVVLVCGAGTAAVGAFVHGLTALEIHAAVASGAAAASPVESVAASGGLLVATWIAAAVLVLGASIAVVVTGTSRQRALPRWLPWLNPAAVSVVLAAAGLPCEVGRSYLVPAAPNLAHVVFFGAACFALGRGSR